VAPVKCGIFPLLAKDGLPEIAMELSSDLKAKGIAINYDPSGSIGRRYARIDEIGTPFALTVDHRTFEDGTVTIRERDSGEQRRIRSSEAADIVSALVLGTKIFSSL
jgi:glycyl-tRNA synthetase